jgi:hypothetical protein
MREMRGKVAAQSHLVSHQFLSILVRPYIEVLGRSLGKSKVRKGQLTALEHVKKSDLYLRDVFTREEVGLTSGALRDVGLGNSP